MIYDEVQVIYQSYWTHYDLWGLKIQVRVLWSVAIMNKKDLRKLPLKSKIAYNTITPVFGLCFDCKQLVLRKRVETSFPSSIYTCDCGARVNFTPTEKLFAYSSTLTNEQLSALKTFRILLYFCLTKSYFFANI